MLTLTIQTEPKLRSPKSNPLFGKIKKIQSINGAVGYDYSAVVGRQLVKEGKPPDFQAVIRKGMRHIGGAILENDKGESYVFLRPLSYSDAIYYVDGKQTDIEGIKSFLYFPPNSGSGRQGTDKAIPYINVKLSNILYVKGLSKGICTLPIS
jgi:hypothetical protein